MEENNSNNTITLRSEKMTERVLAQSRCTLTEKQFKDKVNRKPVQ